MSAVPRRAVLAVPRRAVLVVPSETKLWLLCLKENQQGDPQAGPPFRRRADGKAVCDGKAGRSKKVFSQARRGFGVCVVVSEA